MMINEWLSSVSLRWLLVLWIIWAVLLFGGMLFGRWNSDQSHRSPRWGRMASSVALVFAAWFGAYLVRDQQSAGYAVLISMGMTLGLLGDLFMARLIPISNYVLGGIGAFGIGHLFYIGAFVIMTPAYGTVFPEMRWDALLVWLVIGVVGWFFVVYRPAHDRTLLHKAALPYALLLSSTAGFATGLAFHDLMFVPLAVGAALFLMSDLLLAAELFNGLHFRGIGDVVWLLYGPGQMLIVYSAVRVFVG